MVLMPAGIARLIRACIQPWKDRLPTQTESTCLPDAVACRCTHWCSPFCCLRMFRACTLPGRDREIRSSADSCSSKGSSSWSFFKSFSTCMCDPVSVAQYKPLAAAEGACLRLHTDLFCLLLCRHVQDRHLADERHGCDELQTAVAAAWAFNPYLLGSLGAQCFSLDHGSLLSARQLLITSTRKPQ